MTCASSEYAINHSSGAQPTQGIGFSATVTSPKIACPLDPQSCRWRKVMKKIAVALAVCLISSAPAFATCKSDAADKKLAGAALKSFMTKCERDATTTCEADSRQKNLAGAAKTSHMKKCVADAVGT